MLKACVTCALVYSVLTNLCYITRKCDISVNAFGPISKESLRLLQFV